MKRYKISLLLLIAILIGGFTVSKINAFDDIYRIFSVPEALTVPISRSAQILTACDQSATTAPCNAIPSKKPSAPVQTVEVAPTKAYGPLSRAYTDVKYGFGIRYPDGFQASHDGETTIIADSSKDKGFVLKMETCTQQSPCVYSVDISAGSLEAFAAKHTFTYKHEELVHTYGTNLPWTIIPVQNTTLTLPNGKKLLKQEYKNQILDDAGNDVTERVCDECGGVKTQYIALLKTGVALVITPGPFNDAAMEAQLVQSITY